MAEPDAPELQVAGDLARRALPVAPVMLAVAGAIWGWAGVWSAAFGLALVVANFLAAAALMAWGARISTNALMASVLIGYVVRLALVVGALVLVKDAGWVAQAPLFGTVLVTHVGLLAWEARYVSLSLAYPGLKPGRSSSGPVKEPAAP